MIVTSILENCQGVLDVSTSKFLGSVAAVVGGHHVDVGVAQQLVDHLVAIVQMIRLFSGIELDHFGEPEKLKLWCMIHIIYICFQTLGAFIHWYCFMLL